MTLYMPPLQRKKRVPSRYNPDSFRVISDDAEYAHPKFSPKPDYRPPTPEREKSGISLPDIYNRKTQVMPKNQPDYRVHKPHPGSCGFLRHNVRVLNEPICSVFTADTHTEQNMWWPSRTSDDPLKTPPQTKDTTYRGDFMKETSDLGPLHRTTRHEANTKRDPALGTVPVNFLHKRDGTQRVFKETKSYEHDYNCRSATNYPIRGRRVGSFVYDEMSPDLTQRFINQNNQLIDQDAEYRRQLSFQSGTSSATSGPSGDSSSSSSKSSSQGPTSPKQSCPEVKPSSPKASAPKPSTNEGAPKVEENSASTPAQNRDAPRVEANTELDAKSNGANTKTVTFDATISKTENEQ